MTEKLHEPIDHINEEHPAPGSDEANQPVLFTAVICVCMIVLLVWLFVPGRVAAVRARPTEGPRTTITAPPAQEVHEQLERQRSGKDTEENPSENTQPTEN